MVADVQRVKRRAMRSSPQLEYHLLLLVTLGLVAFGLIMVYSRIQRHRRRARAQPRPRLLIKQAIYAVVGVVGMLVLARFNYRRLRYFAAPILFISIGLLIAVKIPGIGVSNNGAQRWIYVGPISIQPSEFAKAAVLIFCAAVLASRRRPPRTLTQLFNPVGAVVLVVLLLIHSQPDLGTSIAIALMVCGVLVVAGTPLRLFSSVALVGLIGVAYTVARQPYQMERIRTFMDPWQDPTGAGYQSIQALLALGSGGITGVGLGNGTQKIGFLPEAPTDMIGAVIGEELGLLGILATVIGVRAVHGARLPDRASLQGSVRQVPGRRHHHAGGRPGNRQLRRRARLPAADRCSAAVDKLRRFQPGGDAEPGRGDAERRRPTRGSGRAHRSRRARPRMPERPNPQAGTASAC